MKLVYEYKLHRKPDGTLSRPEWVSDGGYFHKNWTELTVEDGDDIRPWYIPDTVNTLSYDDFKGRVLSIHQDSPYMDMTVEQVETWIDQWWNEKVVEG